MGRLGCRLAVRLDGHPAAVRQPGQPDPASNGQDYGYYKSDAVNKKIDAALTRPDLNKQAAAWGDIDEQLAKDVAYIPLANQKFFLMWGSGVKG